MDTYHATFSDVLAQRYMLHFSAPSIDTAWDLMREQSARSNTDFLIQVQHEAEKPD
jgi:hypothetical protein